MDNKRNLKDILDKNLQEMWEKETLLKILMCKLGKTFVIKFKDATLKYKRIK